MKSLQVKILSKEHRAAVIARLQELGYNISLMITDVVQRDVLFGTPGGTITDNGISISGDMITLDQLYLEPRAIRTTIKGISHDITFYPACLYVGCQAVSYEKLYLIEELINSSNRETHPDYYIKVLNEAHRIALKKRLVELGFASLRHDHGDFLYVTKNEVRWLNVEPAAVSRGYTDYLYRDTTAPNKEIYISPECSVVLNFASNNLVIPSTRETVTFKDVLELVARSKGYKNL